MKRLRQLQNGQQNLFAQYSCNGVLINTKNKLGVNITYPESREALHPAMVRPLIEKHLRLGSRGLFRSEDHARLLPDVVIQQLAVRRDGELSLYPVVTRHVVPFCNKAKKRVNKIRRERFTYRQIARRSLQS